jgi:hypothetical protein
MPVSPPPQPRARKPTAKKKEIINNELEKKSIARPSKKVSGKRRRHSSSDTPDLSTDSDDSDAHKCHKYKRHKLKRRRGYTPEQINIGADSSELEATEVYSIPTSEDERQTNGASGNNDNESGTEGSEHDSDVVSIQSVSWGDRSAKAWLIKRTLD